MLEWQADENVQQEEMRRLMLRELLRRRQGATSDD